MQVSASYLGSYLDRLWGNIPLNPGVFLGLGPARCRVWSYPVCTTAANLEQRRALTLQNPREGQLLSYVSQYTAMGTQKYDGLKLSFRRRAADGVSLSGNYTLSHCVTDTPVSGNFIQFSEGYTDPNDPSLRSRQLPAEPPPDRQPDDGLRDAAVRQRACCARWRRTGARPASCRRARATG